MLRGHLYQQFEADRERFLDFVHPSLMRNDSFLKEIIQISCGRALSVIPQDIQRQYPAAVCFAAPVMINGDEIAAYVAPDLWEDRSFVLEWVKAGATLVDKFLHDKFRNSKVFWLEVAAARFPERSSTACCPECCFCEDDNFTREVTKRNTTLYRICSEELRCDNHLALLAVEIDISFYFEKVVPKTLLNDFDVKVCALAGGSH